MADMPEAIPPWVAKTAPLARGLFCLSRSVGILAHAWEQTQQGGRNKGPIPRDMIWTYSGHPPRNLPD